MKAIKGNKVYTIDDKQKKTYVDAGFDIKDEDGNVIAHGRGKTVPYADYAVLQEENKKLQEENKELRERVEMLTADSVDAAETQSEETAEPGRKTGKK